MSGPITLSNTFQRPPEKTGIDRFPPRRPTPKFYECGICDAMHWRKWNGDCRQNDARFFADELDEHYGFNGWSEVDMPT